MKFLKPAGDNLVFQLGPREKSLLLDVLKLYPLVPPSHGRISSSIDTPAMESDQHLLEEALTEHRTENKRQLQVMLAAPNRFESTATGFQLALTPEQVEWLLQVLNDIRVGSWLALGSPDEKQGKQLRVSLENARYLWAMELAGHFQHALLSGREE